MLIYQKSRFDKNPFWLRFLDLLNLLQDWSGLRLFPLQNSVHSMKCRQTMLHVECRTINHFSRLDKRIKIEITSYSYNFEIVVYSFFDKNIFSFSNKTKLKLKTFFLSLCMDLGFCCCAKSYPNHAGTRCCSPACFQYRFPSSREILDWALKIKRSERSF